MKAPNIRTIDLSYDRDNSKALATRIVYAVLPEWEEQDGELKFETFTQGITNTVRFMCL